MYGSWDMKHDGQSFLSFWTVCCPFTPTKSKNQTFQTLKKTPGAFIILHKWIKNRDHMLYCSLDMAHNGCNCYFSFWAIFCPFTSVTAQKNKLKENKKNTWKYHYFTIVYQKPKIMIICYTVPEIWCTTDRRMNGRMDRRMDRWTGGWADGQMDRQMDRQRDRKSDI